MKPVYGIDAPDQPRLKAARAEIAAIIKRYDLAGIVMLHTPGMGEFFYELNPSYSIVHLDGENKMVQIRSKLVEDYGGNQEAQHHDQAASANMVAVLADMSVNSMVMFAGLQHVVDKSLRATHSPGGFTPDPRAKS